MASANNSVQPTSPDDSAWHEGELAVQLRAGVGEVSGRGIRSQIPDGLAGFLSERRLVVFSSVDPEGRVWASLLIAQPGFLRVLNQFTLETDAANLDEDPLLLNLKQNTDVGMVIIDLATRRRVRINGEAEVLPNDGLRIQARQVYGNCQQYIQLRVAEETQQSKRTSRLISRESQLTPAQSQWIARADTLFIATAHPEHGADASHRGGRPGFVRVDGNSSLTIPDYSGNNMFNTLGNISVNPQAGLVFPDFEQGRTLQLSGSATIDWDSDRTEFPGAHRLLVFDIERVIEIEQPALSEYAFKEYSPCNP